MVAVIALNANGLGSEVDETLILLVGSPGDFHFPPLIDLRLHVLIV